MKITSINFVRESDLPTPKARSTQSALQVAQIVEQLKKAPAGQTLAIKATGLKRWTRYALQKKLQKAGAKVYVTQEGAETLHLRRG